MQVIRSNLYRLQEQNRHFHTLLFVLILNRNLSLKDDTIERL